MARIRTIKPEFPHSESIGRLTRDARLTFIQIWTIVDDEGRARAASRMLASLLFPYDDDAPGLVDDWLDELDHAGFIVRYEVNGSRYLEVVNWAKHQRIDKPSASKFPPPPTNSPKPREPSRGGGDGSGPRTRDQDQDQDRAAAAPQAQAGAREQPEPGTDAELRGWLGPIVGTEPVALDVDMTPIRVLLEDPQVTRGDVETGIHHAIDRGRQRFRSWSQFEAWIRRAAKDRLGAQPRASPQSGVGPRRDGPRNPHLAVLDAFSEAS